MDLFSDFFPHFRVKQAFYTKVCARAPWGFDFQAYRHTKFGIVTEGGCYLDLLDGHPPILLQKGACYLLTRGDAFRLRDTLSSGTVDFEFALRHLDGRVLRWGGDGVATTVVGGRFVFETDRYPPQLDLLPPLLHFRVDEHELPALVATVQLLAQETIAPSMGSRLMVDRLADIFFIQALRSFLSSEGGLRVGWLGAVADPKLSKAIRIIHTESYKPWTLADIAAQVGMSRAVFAARFKSVMGIAPMAYLSRHRMNIAQQLLRDTGKSVAQVAQAVGYESEAAFNRTFKRELGATPGAFRRKKEPA